MKRFTELLECYQEKRLKALSIIIQEEPDNEQFTKELKDAEEKAEGKPKVRRKQSKDTIKPFKADD